MSQILIPISPGELLDRISICEIRLSHLNHQDKAAKVHAEIMGLRAAWLESAIGESHLRREIADLWHELWGANRRGWDLEDTVRGYEARKDFGASYAEACYTQHLNNDQRTGLKRAINDLLGVDAMEEKFHTRQ